MNNKYSDSTLTIDLSAIAGNYLLLKEKSGGAAAVVKANAYGLGVEKVAPAIYEAGCREFFVANLDEAVQLRSILAKANIYVFHGVQKGQEKVFCEYNLVPVLNSMDQLELWQQHTDKKELSAILHFDTGMNRLGFSAKDVEQIIELLSGIKLHYIMSHLACADDVENPKNELQLSSMQQISKFFPGVAVSLANSCGIFLDEKYHFDLVRPGSALYGINPTVNAKNPMKQPVLLTSCILQIHEIDTPGTVGYGATYELSAGSRVATLPVGYADGYIRSLGNKGFCAIKGKKVPVIGRVSMDLITVDVTDIPAGELKIGAEVEIIGNTILVDDLAENAGTIGYEILTNLGRRYKRIY